MLRYVFWSDLTQGQWFLLQRSSNEKSSFFTEMVLHYVFLIWDTKISITPSCSPRWASSKHALLTLKGQFQNLTSGQVRSRSGQGQIMTQVGQYAHHPKLLDEPSRVAPLARLYHQLVATYWQNTDYGLIWLQVKSRSSVAPGSSQMGWVAMILTKLDGFRRLMRNGKHFHLSP